MRKADSAAPLPILDVLNGSQAGASAPLGPGRWQLGSSLDCDLVLRDEHVALCHAVIRIDGKHANVEALGQPVVVREAARQAVQLPRGTGCRCLLPVSLALGETQVRVAYPQDRAERRVWSPPAALIMLAAPAAMAALAYAGFSGGGTDAYASHLPNKLDAAQWPRTAAERDQAVSPSVAAVADAPQASPLAALQARIRQENLHGLQVHSQAGYVRVSGELPETDMPRWRAVQAWFDEHYGARRILHSTVQAQATRALPQVRVRAVWLGESPYLIDGRGQRLYPGAALSDGWVLKRIDAKGIVLARGGREHTLQL